MAVSSDTPPRRDVGLVTTPVNAARAYGGTRGREWAGRDTCGQHLPDRGQATDVPVAWLDVAAGALAVLHQHYERRAVDVYWYEAPRFGYGALLTVNAAGFVVKYPGLWEAEF